MNNRIKNIYFQLIIMICIAQGGIACTGFAADELCLSPVIRIEDLGLQEKFSQDMSLDDIKEYMFSVPQMHNQRTEQAVYRINQEEAFYSAQTLSIIEMAGSNYECAVLDIGAGKGNFLTDMSKTARRLNQWVQSMRATSVMFDFYGFEINENKADIQQLQEQALINNDDDFGQLEWEFGETAENLPEHWEDKFTFIFATRSLEYCRDPLQAIEEAYRVLKPGGRAVISMSLINQREYNRRSAKLNSADSKQRQEAIGHIYFEGIDLAAEIEKLKQEYDIELYATSQIRLQRVKVDNGLMQQFAQGRNFPFSHFVIVMNKREGAKDLQFNYVLEKADNIMHRRYISRDDLLLPFEQPLGIPIADSVYQSI